jgi:hypothetical protein
MKNWKQQFKKLEEENEFYGLPYDENTSSLIEKFISHLLQEILWDYSKWLEKHSYLDADYYTEEPNSIDAYIKDNKLI